MSLRKYTLDRALELTLSATRLRRPQREALEAFDDLIRKLDFDLHELSAADLTERVRDLRPDWEFPDGYPGMTCLLATGVGKTRLMGAMMAYLYLGGQARTFVIAAPRTAILRKLIAECHRGSDKYLFVEPNLVPEPRVWHAGNIDTFRPREQDIDLFEQGPDIFVYSPQSFVGPNRRTSIRSEFTGVSVARYLRDAPDTVLFADEAHHLGDQAEVHAAAWTTALRELEPRLLVGMTATPRRERGQNLLHTYDLPTCLREGLYTKDVRVIVEQRRSSDLVSDEDWDQRTLDFALARLARKGQAIRDLVILGKMSAVNPILLVCAQDTGHADAVGRWLCEHRGFGEDQVLVVHSKRSENESSVARLVGVESLDSPVRVVVNVHKLTEGWDVTNVYVIAPLRAMGTYIGAVQAMGRGLRLPEGRRLRAPEAPEADTLDVLCFGRQSLQEILDEALKEFGDADDQETGIGIEGSGDIPTDDPPERVHVTLPARAPIEITLPSVRRVPNEPDLDFDPSRLKRLVSKRAAEFHLKETDATFKSTEELTYEWETFVRLCAGRVIGGLRYLSVPLHRDAIEELVAKVLGAAEIEQGSPVSADWVAVAMGLIDQIDRPYRKQEIRYFVKDGSAVVRYDDCEWLVPEDRTEPARLTSTFRWATSYSRIPITGWRRSVHLAVPLDVRPEFSIARILDRDDEVEWWARNDPPRLRIPTPVGNYEPDFVVRTKDGRMMILEVKGANHWKPPDSDPRVKARATDAWCAAASQPPGAEQWLHVVALDADIEQAATLHDVVSWRANQG